MSRPAVRCFLALAVSSLAAATPAAEVGEPYLVRDVDLVGHPIGVCGAIPECPESSAFPFGSDPTQLTPVGDRLFFVADDGVHGPQVWVTDGTWEGTRAASGPERGNPLILASLGDRVFFQDRLGPIVHSTDGTPEGTVEVLDLSLRCHEVPFGCFRPSVASTAVAGDRLYLAWENEPAAGRLFRSDGTPGGTVEVPLGDVAAIELLGLGERLFLVGGPPPGGASGARTGLFELAADGSLIARASACSFVGGFEGLAALDGDLYFYAACIEQAANGAGTSLYRLDGGSGAVEEVADRVVPGAGLPPFAGAAPPLVPPVAVGGRLHFVRTIDGDRQLWSAAAGSLARVASGLPAEMLALAAAGDRPVFLLGEPRRPGTLFAAEGGVAVPLAPHAGPTELVSGDGGFAYLFAGEGEDHGLVRTDGTAAGTARIAAVRPAFPTSVEVALAGGRVYFPADDGVHGIEPWAVEVEGPAAFGCVADGSRLCLADGRFAVSVTWRDPRSGDTGAGAAVGETADSGFFWFFDPANLEVLVKVLDARAVNGHHWVFHGSLTDVEYELRVEDLATGDVRTYRRPAGSLCGGADAAAFPTGAAGGSAAGGRGAGAAAAAPLLALGDGDRFGVAVEWLDPATGAYREAATVEKTADSGWAWFFDPANVEVFVKVLDARAVDGHFWVFHGGLTDLGYRLTVTDGTSGAQRVYEKPPGSLCGGADTAAF